jgi:3'-5' exonuclease
MSKELYLVFDIETAPLPFEGFSESQQEYLLRGANTEEEKAKKMFEMALSPMTSQVVCIGLQLMQGDGTDNWELIKKAAFSCRKDSPDDAYENVLLGDGSICHISSERKVIEDFWKILAKYNHPTLISFNGRNFDAPFLMLRSALLKVKPSKNLMSGTKFNYPSHYDLIDELCFFNPSSYGATRRYNFDFYTRAFGITSPKSEGVDGSMVGTMYNEGKVAEIAEYCLRDVNATWELFLIWRNYLKF